MVPPNIHQRERYINETKGDSRFLPPNFRLKELKLIHGFVEKVRSLKLR